MRSNLQILPVAYKMLCHLSRWKNVCTKDSVEHGGIMNASLYQKKNYVTKQEFSTIEQHMTDVKQFQCDLNVILISMLFC